MPIPKPNQGESQSEFVSRCMSFFADEGSSLQGDQRVAACYSAWRQAKKEEVEKSLTHNSTIADSEPSWGSVDKTKLPRNAHADMGDPSKKSTWGYPHHWIKGGSVGEDGVYTSGTMYLHKGGLNAAWAAAHGARSGQSAGGGIISHLNAHRKVLGMDKEKDFERANNPSIGSHSYPEVPELPEGMEKPKSYLEMLENEIRQP